MIRVFHHACGVSRWLTIPVSRTRGGVRRHTRAGVIAETAGVSERTMRRWLRQARGGLEARSRKNGVTLSDALWAEIARVDGNVSAVRRA